MGVNLLDGQQGGGGWYSAKMLPGNRLGVDGKVQYSRVEISCKRGAH